MNKLPSLDLEFSKNLATTQIIALGNLIGDVLWLLEIEMIKMSRSKPYVQKINKLIDLYAKQFDELLVKQERRIFEDMENLFKLLLSDLESIRTDSLKFYKNTIKDTL
ncbi:hypothetical protein Megpolyxen_01757 (plasmid) [Candidatus Megaera polyxenophila]|nr:hypothetical protein Megpolyxen_01757 [Candidatus Megaera polyxenophila]